MCPYSYSWLCGYFQVPWVSFVTVVSSQWESQEIISRIGVSWTHNLPFCFWPILTQWIMAILSKGCKSDNFESHNSLKSSFTNIWDLCSDFVECEYFLESNSLDILALCETNLYDLTDSDNFSVRGCLPLIGKDFITHMHGLAVYVKEGLPLAQDLSIENSVYSYLCFQLVLLNSVSYFFFLFQSPYLYVQFLMLFYLTYMRLSWFVLGNFNIIIKTG